MVINAVAPMIAPMVGGAILSFESANWRSIFFFLAIIGILIVFIVAMKLKETLPPEKRSPSSLGETDMTMRNLLKDSSFIGYELNVGIVPGVIFIYLFV